MHCCLYSLRKNMPDSINSDENGKSMINSIKSCQENQMEPIS
uniref:Uncharacterized protein n=1 Tax=Rhizophora mucronata TaxID=61149 RepID=A0A2P2PR57_RHIMU